LQSADKESRAVTEESVKFNMYRNLHRASRGRPFITASLLTLLFADGRDAAIIVNSVKTEITQYVFYHAYDRLSEQQLSFLLLVLQ